MNETTLAPVEEQAVVAQQTEAVATTDDSEVSGGHKVAFCVILGIAILSIVGIPVAIFMLKKNKELKKKNDQLEAALAEKAGTETPATQPEATKEAQAETKPETK